MVELGVFQRAAAVVCAIVYIDHFHTRIEQGNGRQDSVTMQAIRVQTIGREVGGGHKAHAIGKQRLQQAIENHGVCDVGHMKLVKTDQLVLFGDFGTQRIQRVLRALHQVQLAVHLAHEFMKVQTHLAFDGHRIEKAVHQKALATPYPAVHVNALGQIGVVEQFFERVGAFVFINGPVISAALQCLNSTQLRRIALKTLGGQFCLVGLFYIHRRLQMLKKQ